MQRVVVFMGGSSDAVAAMQHSLPGNVKVLARAGVVVPSSGRSGNKTTGLSHQPLGSRSGAAWAALRAELRSADDRTVLLFIPTMLRIGTIPDRRREILRRLSSLSARVTLVSVVEEQLSMINDYYLGRVATWRISRRLDGSVGRLVDNDAFVHETLLRPWYEQRGVSYAALPTAAFDGGHPVMTVLSAAGVDVDVDVEMPRPVVPDLPKLGSTGVEANRLLATYLRAEIPGFKPDDDGVAAASLSGLARAQKLGWCDDSFWGWTPRAVEKALARFDASNQRFARAVWGTAWQLPYPLDRQCTQGNVLDLDFPVVDQVHRYVMSMADKVARERKAAT